MEGTSFLAALEDRYADSDGGTAKVITRSNKKIFVMKNMDVAGVSGCVRVPREMSLHRYDITHAGDLGKIKEICSQITSLDLAENKFSDWSEVFSLLTCLPNLLFLNLSGNLLENAIHPPTDDSPTFPSVKKLALNQTSVELNTIAKLLLRFPSVEELHLCMNGYTTLDCPGVFPNVRSIMLNGNKVADFIETLKLSTSFPNMEQLLLLQNPIARLPEPEQIAQAFTNLSVLNISESKVSSWAELEKLKHFPALVDLRIKLLPLYKDMEEGPRRQLIIAYLPNITRLNLSAVSGEERETAERMFTRHYMDVEEKPDRFHELHSKYKDVCKFAEVNFDPGYSRVVEVHYNDEVTLKTIDTRQSLGELRKRIAEEVAHLPPKQLSVHFKNAVDECGPIRMTNMQKKVYSLMVEDGDMFIFVKYYS